MSSEIINDDYTNKMEALRLRCMEDYISGKHNLKDISRKYNIPYQKVLYWKKTYSWVQLRDEYDETVSKLVVERMMDVCESNVQNVLMSVNKVILIVDEQIQHIVNERLYENLTDLKGLVKLLLDLSLVQKNFNPRFDEQIVDKVIGELTERKAKEAQTKLQEFGEQQYGS